MPNALDMVMKYVGHDPSAVLCEHEDWDAMPRDAWVAYHSLNVLKDPTYLKFVTDKLQKYVSLNMKWASAMDAVTAADMHRDCDVTSPESVVEHMSKLSLRQLEIVGI
jgi:hypothetical protein